MKRSNQLLLFLGFILSFSAFSANAQRAYMWCVAKAGVSEEELESYIVYVCSYPNPHLDCTPIRPGGACFDPDNKHNHASYALDLYYRKLGACPDINSVGTLTSTDPSYGNCHFP